MDNNKVLGFFEKITTLLREHKKHFIMGGVALIALSIPIVIAQVLKNQDVRQRAAVGDPVTLSFSPSSGPKSIGNEFDVQLLITTNTNDISAIDGYLKYYDSILQLVSTTPGTPYKKVDNVLDSYEATADGNNPTHIKVNRIVLYNDTQTPVTGQDKIAVTFRFKAIANGTAAIGFDSKPNDNTKILKIAASGFAGNVPTTNTGGPRVGASFTVGTVTTSPSPTVTTAPSPSVTISPAPTVNPNVDNTLTPPTNLQPNGTIDPGTKNIEWTASDKASGGYYVRVNEDGTGADNWTPGACDNGSNVRTGDMCEITTSTSYQYTFKPNKSYFVWVHSRGTTGKYGNPVTSLITTKPAARVDLCTATKNKPTNCVCQNDSECRSTLCSSGRCSPRPTQAIENGHTGLKFSVALPGVGQKLDNNEDNQNPINPSRIAGIQLFDAANNPVLQEINQPTQADSILKNGDIASCNTTDWATVISIPTLASSGTGDACFMTATCTGDGCSDATKDVSFYQDIPITDKILKHGVTISGRFGTVSGTATGRLALHQTSIKGGGILTTTVIPLSLTTDYQAVTKTLAKINPRTQFLRYQLYLDNPRTNIVKVDDLKVVINTNSSVGAKRALAFNTSTYKFEGAIDLGTGFTTGNYTAKLTLDNTLTKLLPGIITITGGSANNAGPHVDLPSGDIDQSNTLGVSDWTDMIACTRDEAACTPDIRALGDLNDDGALDREDVHLLLRGFAVRNGD